MINYETLKCILFRNIHGALRKKNSIYFLWLSESPEDILVIALFWNIMRRSVIPETPSGIKLSGPFEEKGANHEDSRH
ncbi:MAG: hypothetical protein JXR72_00865, partial [Proteobacteria bacterium]|nr:hypothetical protein [Pseudomonadota bacterium]